MRTIPVQVLCITLMFMGCIKDDINKADKMFAVGEYQQSIQLCQKILSKNPKPEFREYTQKLVLECLAGLDYKTVIESAKKNDESALKSINVLKGKNKGTSFAKKFDSLYKETYNYLLQNDSSFSDKMNLTGEYKKKSENLKKEENGSKTHEIEIEKITLNKDGTVCHEDYKSMIWWSWLPIHGRGASADDPGIVDIVTLTDFGNWNAIVKNNKIDSIGFCYGKRTETYSPRNGKFNAMKEEWESSNYSGKTISEDLESPIIERYSLKDFEKKYIKD